jgi:hypothetical protein
VAPSRLARMSPRIAAATPDPDGFDTTVTLDSPVLSISRGGVDRVLSLLARVRSLPAGMPLRIATAGGPPIEVQGVEIRQIEQFGEQVWAVVLVPEGVEPRRQLKNDEED